MQKKRPATCIMNLCSPNMPPLTYTDLQRIFEDLDRNRDGLVTLLELNLLLERIGWPQLGSADLEWLAAGKSALDLPEFCSFYESISKRGGDRWTTLGIDDSNNNNDDDDDEADLSEAFKVFDLNGDGFISSEELQSVLARLGLWEEDCGRDCGKMIRVYDVNSDGMLDFDEFKKMMMLSIS